MSFVETLDGLALKKSALVHRFEHLIASKSDQELETMARKSRALTLQNFGRIFPRFRSRSARWKQAIMCRSSMLARKDWWFIRKPTIARSMRKCILPDRSATLIFDWIARSAVTAQDFAGSESVCSLGYLPGSKKRSPSRRIWNICSNFAGRRRSV